MFIIIHVYICFYMLIVMGVHELKGLVRAHGGPEAVKEADSGLEKPALVELAK